MQPADPWHGDAAWWLAEVEHDPIYESDVLPLVASLTGGATGPWLDVGCGNGRAATVLPAPAFGCDISSTLLAAAADHLPGVRCRLPDLRWLRSSSLGGASLILVVEHIADVEGIIEALHRVVRPRGHLAMVINHPAFTAPDAGPLVDPDDGEVLWRWGPYFEEAEVLVRIGSRSVVFHHRPLGRLLTTVARTGWRLQTCEERPLSAAAIDHEPGYAGQEHAPRLLGIRWER
jgi:SAM-dependent methyltransferase